MSEKKKWIFENLQQIDFEHTPYLKKLLIDYISATYEGDAIFSDEYLRMELIRLAEDEEFPYLFLQEWFNSKGFFINPPFPPAK